jgi:hypothetical protein
MPKLKEEQTAHVTLDLVDPPGEIATGEGFLILAISAGVGNGWNFSTDVLRRSLPLWDGVECFVDHAGQGSPFAGRSVRDMGGVCSSPGWDEARQGIRLALTPIGPAADVIRTVGREMLNRTGTTVPRVGFSADLLLRPARSVTGNVK